VSQRPKKAPRRLSDAGFDAVARRFQILSDPIRLKLLHHLRSGPLHVGALVQSVDRSQANVSKHLSVLLAAGIVRREQRGTMAVYEIADPTVFQLCESVCTGIEQARLADRLYE
jgi:ArsR family transcriptional regulator